MSEFDNSINFDGLNESLPTQGEFNISLERLEPLHLERAQSRGVSLDKLCAFEESNGEIIGQITFMLNKSIDSVALHARAGIELDTSKDEQRYMWYQFLNDVVMLDDSEFTDSWFELMHVCEIPWDEDLMVAEDRKRAALKQDSGKDHTWRPTMNDLDRALDKGLVVFKVTPKEGDEAHIIYEYQKDSVLLRIIEHAMTYSERGYLQQRHDMVRRAITDCLFLENENQFLTNWFEFIYRLPPADAFKDDPSEWRSRPYIE